jgi:hypothetical protein
MRLKMTIDSYQNVADSLISPAQTAFVITPSDQGELIEATRAIYVGGGGDILVQMIDGGNDVLFRNVIPGSMLPFRLKAVKATGTTATHIVGLA